MHAEAVNSANNKTLKENRPNADERRTDSFLKKLPMAVLFNIVQADYNVVRAGLNRTVNLFFTDAQPIFTAKYSKNSKVKIMCIATPVKWNRYTTDPKGTAYWIFM